MAHMSRPGWLSRLSATEKDFVAALHKAHQDELDEEIERRTRGQDARGLMERLQQVGVPAGVCQDVRDRYETDPQLAHLGWLVELQQSELGTWPVKGHPVHFSETPAYIGGPHDRSGPSYGEDTDAVLTGLLGLDPGNIAQLREEGVV